MPKQWPQVALGEILTERNETPDPTLIKRGIIPIISKIRFSDGEIEYRAESGTNTKMILIHPGDLVLSGINAMKGAIAIYQPETSQRATATIHYAAYEVNKEKADIRYLWWLLRSQYFQEILTQQVPQGIKTELKAKRLLPVSVPLPNIDEQRRILIIIESLLSRISELNVLQEKSIVEIKALLPSIRSKTFSSFQLQYPLLPLSEIADIQLGKMLSPKSKSGENPLPYLRNANVQWDLLDLSFINKMDFSPKEIEKYSLLRGDILVCEGGKIGRAAIWNNEIDGCLYQKALHRVRVDLKKVFPRYILHCLFWGSTSGQFSDLKTQTTIPHLPAIKLKRFLIPVPPLAIQNEVVDYLDNMQNSINRLLYMQQVALNEQNDLIASILSKAFQGV